MPRYHRPTWARTAPGWVAAAADDPSRVRDLWRVDPGRPVALPTGRTFDAVTVDLRTGMEAVDLLRHGGLPVAGCRTGGPAARGAARRGVDGHPSDTRPVDGRGAPDGHGAAPERAREARAADGRPADRRATLCRAWVPAGRARTGLALGGLVGGGLFPALVDHERERMRLLVPRGSGGWFGAPAADRGLGAAEYHGDGATIALPGPAAGAGDRLAWAVRPGAPVDRMRALLDPLVAALTAARATVAWCSGSGPAPLPD
ncbi:hypothetical protein [Streptomyces sp. NPDC018031]|uniref:hypothetical protein n=1 Tax=Streptomyces sp. NPDC018031 TaxID=3365033 RepID=UPI00378A9B07